LKDLRESKAKHESKKKQRKELPTWLKAPYRKIMVHAPKA
jgi:hypothetical protein